VERKLYAALGSKSGREAKSLHARFQQGLGDLSEEERAKADYLVNSLIESSYAEDVEYLHPRLLEFGKEFGGGDVLFPEGYSQVFDPRFSKFEVRIDCAVEKVDWGSHGATLTTTQGEHSADRVILTLPLGVLKKGSISFSPGLPDSKLTAINAMGMGCLNKLYLKFPETFWPVDCSGISYQSPKTGHWSQWLNFAPYTRSPILAGFTAGSFARETEQWSDMETVTSAMETLRRLFGSSIPEPVAFQRTRWNSDPYSLGSYSARRPGVGQSMIQALGEPIDGRIFFAGEATSVDYPSTVHGAYLSGQREAERLALA
ncbi:MAG: NAD(P)/FAD-dependent oxidoreductase, partial [Verrucomicrobiota bacterium]